MLSDPKDVTNLTIEDIDRADGSNVEDIHFRHSEASPEHSFLGSGTTVSVMSRVLYPHSLPLPRRVIHKARMAISTHTYTRRCHHELVKLVVKLGLDGNMNEAGFNKPNAEMFQW